MRFRKSIRTDFICGSRECNCRNKEKISSGLCNIFIEIEGSTKEIIKQKLERYYGKLLILRGEYSDRVEPQRS